LLHLSDALGSEPRTLSAERARKSNDAQVMALGAQIIAPTLACTLVDRWLASEFNEARSGRTVDKIRALDSTLRE